MPLQTSNAGQSLAQLSVGRSLASLEASHTQLWWLVGKKFAFSEQHCGAEPGAIERGGEPGKLRGIIYPKLASSASMCCKA